MANKKRRSSGSFNSVTSCISTTLVLILFGTVVFFVTMADNLSRSLRENFTVQVLLNDSISNKETVKLQDELRKEPYVRLVTYISKEKATREQAEILEPDPEEFLGNSPIPASF
jgi:cell division transport system permease protein